MVRRHRKTAAEVRQEWAMREYRAWSDFRQRLEGVNTYADALRLAHDSAIRPNSPGRRYHSNLAFFLGQFQTPYGSNQTEKALYIQLIQRLDDAKQLKPGVREPIQRALQAAIDAQPEI